MTSVIRSRAQRSSTSRASRVTTSARGNPFVHEGTGGPITVSRSFDGAIVFGAGGFWSGLPNGRKPPTSAIITVSAEVCFGAILRVRPIAGVAAGQRSR